VAMGAGRPPAVGGRPAWGSNSNGVDSKKNNGCWGGRPPAPPPQQGCTPPCRAAYLPTFASREGPGARVRGGQAPPRGPPPNTTQKNNKTAQGKPPPAFEKATTGYQLEPRMKGPRPRPPGVAGGEGGEGPICASTFCPGTTLGKVEFSATPRQKTKEGPILQSLVKKRLGRPHGVM